MNVSAQVTEVPEANSVYESHLYWKKAFRRFRKNGLAMAGLVVILLFLFAAIFGPMLAPYDFLEQDLVSALQGPSLKHWLGTDELGRDIFSRLLYGARTAALVAFSTTAISLFIGIVVGTWAGLQGGRLDEFLMWLSDLVQAVPGLLLVMLINTALRRPIVNWFDRLYEQTRNPFYLNTTWLDFVLVFSALALVAWPGFARLVRGQVLSVGKEDYVMAARALGAKEPRLMRNHVVPNSLGPLVVAVTASMGGAIVMEAGLSFLGLGVQPPNASWGTMLSNGLKMWQAFPHVRMGPAITIGLIQVAFVFLGDGLNDALDPRRVS
jgi:peptide/nickel transport system permease protein